jgi:hypothetical protein
VRRAALLAVVAVLAGCGGGGGSKTETLFSGAGWTVTLRDGKAEVLRQVGGKWVPDRSNAVKIEILGPRPGETLTSNPPQVAISMRARNPLVESALWVDGNRLLEKGGGTPTNGTIYGAPLKLSPGKHTAVGYARTAFNGSAVAWTFTVPKS